MDDNGNEYKEKNCPTTAEASTNTPESSPCVELVTLSPLTATCSSGEDNIQDRFVQLNNRISPATQSQSSAVWKPFGCETCGKRFTLKGSLKTHEKLHGFRPTYNCDVCGKSFKVANGLKAHAALHSGSKPFSCQVCGKTFTLKGSLKTHSILHSEARESFQCHICGKTYKGMASLKSHTALHLGQKPLPLKVCEQVIPRSPNDTSNNDGGTSMMCSSMNTDFTAKQMNAFEFWHRFPQFFHGYELTKNMIPLPGSIPSVIPPTVSVDYSKEEVACPIGDSQDSAILGNHSDDLTFFIGQSFMSKYNKNGETISVYKRPFVCESDKRFTLKGSLKKNEKLHAFHKMHHCNICGKSFNVCMCKLLSVYI